MKILHVGLADRFTEGMTYQDNLLTEQNIKDGHEIIYIGDCKKFVNGKIEKTEPEDVILSNGMRLIRIPYIKVINYYISEKIRAVKGLKQLLYEIKPDVILFHGVAGYELLTVGKYKEKNPKIKLYLDCHQDFYNSATNFFSKLFLHKIFYAILTQLIINQVDKIFSVSYDGFEFLKKMYGVPSEKVELLPLGGVVFPDETKMSLRESARKELKIKDDEILLMHSGKLNKKKKTIELLEAFNSEDIQNKKFKLIIAGTMEEEVKEEIQDLIAANKNIIHLGWVNSDTLLKYLCACDLYLQPGSQSATLQNAVCCGAVAVVYPTSNYKFLLEDNVFYVENKEDIKEVLLKISENRQILADMKEKAYKIGHSILDYREIAKRLYI